MTHQTLVRHFRRWFDSDAPPPPCDDPFRPQWLRILPFAFLHLGCLGVFWTGWSPIALGCALAFYVVRMFAITGFYHRYFSHRTFRTSRFMQFLFALLGATSMQRGALWWAAHHRQHHRYSDGQKDVHSPIRQGFWWSHCLWFTCEAHFPTDYAKVKDLAKFPELRWLNRFDSAIPFLLLPILWGMGSFIEVQWPESQTNGWQFLVWVYFISTTLLAHATFSINSLAHRWGSRPFKTNDQSRNNAFLALLTLGEGWHNNHHRFPSSCRQGLHWWQWDPTYWGLRSLASLGLIWNIQQSPPTTGMPGKKESRT